MAILCHHRPSRISRLAVKVLRSGPWWAGLVVLGLVGVSWAVQGSRAGSKGMAAPAGHTNRLIHETSPYLLQHAHNPVDWYPWGPEAFAAAKKQDKPIFLSIGYSSCYWCHVMEREDFENPEIATLLNKGFICIKVDREEHPEVDEIYMTAVQIFTQGHGGWPVSAFLTPDGKPFFGGTYFPPDDRDGNHGFKTVLNVVHRAWVKDRDDLVRSADKVARVIRQANRPGPRTAALGPPLLAKAVQHLADSFDPQYGGFGYSEADPRQPKFPEPSVLLFLLDQARRHPTPGPGRETSGPAAKTTGPSPEEMVDRTLQMMRRGGIWDHLAGGFHRYSTDRFWMVPHFEKMLYDNAQLASVYLARFEQTHDRHDAAVARATLDFVLNTLARPGGGFYAAIDAESEGEEGTFYVWTKEQVKAALGPTLYPGFAQVYGLRREPNFKGGRYVLYEPRPLAEQAQALQVPPAVLAARLAGARKTLLAVRAARPHPRVDTKVLTDWNGLMLAALADGWRVLGEDRYRAAANQLTGFLLENLRTADGSLRHSYAGGAAHLEGTLNDYAYLIHGLLALHRATGADRWLAEARRLDARMVELFWDGDRGGLFSTTGSRGDLLARTKDASDSALPSGNSVAVNNWLQLAAVAPAGSPAAAAARDRARRTLQAFSGTLDRSPGGVCLMLVGLARFLDQAGPAGGELAGRPKPAKKPGVVQPTLATTAKPLRPGQEFDLTLTLDIRPGWHVNANPAALDYLIPTTVTPLKPGAGSPGLAMTISRVRYPKGSPLKLEGQPETLSVYEGRITIPIRARLGDRAPAGKGMVRLELRYQACDRRSCRAPERIRLEVPVEVTSSGKA